MRPDREHELADEHWGRATYEEIQPRALLRFLDGASTPDGAAVPGSEMPTAVRLAERPGDGTVTTCNVRITVGFPSVRELEQAEAIGMISGFTETLERLDHHMTTTTTDEDTR